jgi:hypothetical protein
MFGEQKLDPALAAEVEAHIDQCPRCQARLENLAWECPTPTSLTLSPCVWPDPGENPRIPGFEIQRELGRGSTGVVYLARQEALGRQVALKVIPANPGDDEEARERWRKEAKAFSLVRHPNVVVLYDVGEFGSWYYLVLEYIPGPTLKTRLSGAMAPRDSAQLMVTIANAVHAIHQASLLHLDLKPSNILMDGETDCSLDITKPKVADFGIARFFVDSEHTDRLGMTVYASFGGTPPYMAPEQTSGTRDQLCPATDVHALGAILYHLVTGSPPGQGVFTLDPVRESRTREPILRGRPTSRVSRDLRTIILKCLEKDSARRYPTALSLAEDLSRWLDGRPIHARPVSLVEHGWRACRRRPGVAILGAVLAATVIVGFGLLLQLYRRAEAQRGRAEAARAAAEENLVIASTVIGHLKQALLDHIDGRHPLDVGQLDHTARLLSEQVVMSMGKTAGFKPVFLLSLSQIDGFVANRLLSAGQLDEARSLTKVRIEILREWTARDPNSDIWPNETIDALYTCFLIERKSMQGEAAFDYLEQASSVVLSTTSTHPERHRFACLFIQEYLGLKEEYDRVADSRRSARASEGHRRLFAMIQNDASGRPDLVLAKACLLADDGQWDRACEVVRTLRPPDQTAQSIQHFQDYLEKGLMGWVDREKRRIAAVDVQNEKAPTSVMWAMMSKLIVQATSERRTGGLEEADRTVSLLMAIAQTMIQVYPNDAAAFDFLSEAHLQRSKNAWQRNDFVTIRRELTQSLEAINRAVDRDPNTASLRDRANDRKDRLAELPSS